MHLVQNELAVTSKRFSGSDISTYLLGLYYSGTRIIVRHPVRIKFSRNILLLYDKHSGSFSRNVTNLVSLSPYLSLNGNSNIFKLFICTSCHKANYLWSALIRTKPPKTLSSHQRLVKWVIFIREIYP